MYNIYVYNIKQTKNYFLIIKIMKTFNYKNRTYSVKAYRYNIEVYLDPDFDNDLEGWRVLLIEVTWDNPVYRDDNYDEDTAMTNWYELSLYLEEDTIIPFLQGEYPYLSFSECEELLLKYL